MFVDASAICAIIVHELEAESLASRLDHAATPPITSAMAIYEAVLAVARLKEGDLAAARRDVASFVRLAGVNVVPIGAAEQDAALDAFDRFGKGRHPARLSMGDCFAYACAKTHCVPLLCKGDDFRQTDAWIA